MWMLYEGGSVLHRGQTVSPQSRQFLMVLRIVTSSLFAARVIVEDVETPIGHVDYNVLAFIGDMAPFSWDS